MQRSAMHLLAGVVHFASGNSACESVPSPRLLMHPTIGFMKGPHERLKYDLRRLWECPVCKRRERTSGGVTFRHCNCQMKQPDGQPVVMKLIEDGVQRTVPPITIDHQPLDSEPAPPAPLPLESQSLIQPPAEQPPLGPPPVEGS